MFLSNFSILDPLASRCQLRLAGHSPGPKSTEPPRSLTGDDPRRNHRHRITSLRSAGHPTDPRPPTRPTHVVRASAQGKTIHTFRPEAKSATPHPQTGRRAADPHPTPFSASGPVTGPDTATEPLSPPAGTTPSPTAAPPPPPTPADHARRAPRARPHGRFPVIILAGPGNGLSDVPGRVR